VEVDTVVLIAVPVLVGLAALVLFTTTRRRDTEGAIGDLSRETVRRDRSDSPFLAVGQEAPTVTREHVEREARLVREGGGTALVPAAPGPALAPYVPPDDETMAVTRRQFFNRSIVAMMGLSISGFGAACLAFVWPTLSGGFGSKIRVGTVDDIISSVRDNREPFYVPEGRFYVQPYPTDAVDKATAAYSSAVLPGMEAGVVALYQKCPHLGCRVPWCETSQWFECPCHGSQYNRVGEKKGGPAPRGMDRFAVIVDGGVVEVDTAAVIEGPPIGTNTTGQEAEGPHCISEAGGGH
jgi:cytochrome b6-f complex iron-sulfur subunit